MAVKKDWITWVEPSIDGQTPQYVYMRTSDAIELYRNTHTILLPDEASLDEFMVVNWAYFCDAPSGL